MYATVIRVAVGKGREGLQKDEEDPANWMTEEVEMKIKEKWGDKVPDVSGFVRGLTGVQLCALPEKEYVVRGGKEVGKEVYLWVWEKITDAKTRRRRDDGTIITKEDEVKERQELIRQKEERARIWAEREKHLRADF